MGSARLVRCQRCRRLFIGTGEEALCPECARELGTGQGPTPAVHRGRGWRAQGPSAWSPWGRGSSGRRGRWAGPSSAWRALAMACGAAMVTGLVVGSVDVGALRLATWAGFAAGMVLADRPQ